MSQNIFQSPCFGLSPAETRFACSLPIPSLSKIAWCKIGVSQKSVFNKYMNDVKKNDTVSEGLLAAVVIWKHILTQ